MNQVAPIIVKRGFLSALVSGVFGTIITALICGAGVGVYAINVLDRKSDGLAAAGRELVSQLPDIMRSMPPFIADACNDRRDLGYRSSVEIESKLLGKTGDDDRVMIQIANKGDHAVTLLALRVAVLDGDQAPIYDTTIYAATPIGADRDWNGPLLPGSGPKRKISVRLPTGGAAQSVAVEVTDIRTWAGPAPSAFGSAAMRDKPETEQ